MRFTVLALALSFAAQAETFSCPQAAANVRSTVLAQTYDRFDATPHDGWRPLGETQHCSSSIG
jgi:hypothetical protein